MNEIEFAQEIYTLWGSMSLPTKTIACLFILHPVASAITAATSTPRDERVWGWLYHRIIRPLALNIGKATDPAKKEHK